MKKTGIVALALVMVIIVVSLSSCARFSLTTWIDGDNWTSVKWEVTEGDDSTLTMKISNGNKLNITYDSDQDLRAIVTFSADDGSYVVYSMYLYEEYDFTTEMSSLACELEPLLG